jgi:hypothetical protein
MVLAFPFLVYRVVSFPDCHQTAMGHRLSQIDTILRLFPEFSLLPCICKGHIPIPVSIEAYFMERLMELRVGSLTASEKRSVSRVEYLPLRSRV